MQAVSVDLVSDPALVAEPDVLAPVDRLELEGVEVCEYPVYPVACAIADKICAIVERHEGRPSSRVKDLVDLLVYMRTSHVSGDDARREVQRELRMRRLGAAVLFSVPQEWHENYQRAYAKLAKRASLEGVLGTLGGGEAAVRAFVDPILDGSAGGMEWDPGRGAWAARND